MNFASIVVLLAIVGYAAFAIRHIKKNKGGCGGNCSQCQKNCK